MSTVQRTEEPVGHLIISEPTIFTQSFESAHCYAEIEVQPGEYPIYGLEEDGQPCSYYSTATDLPGKVVKDQYVSRLGPFSHTDINKHVGEDRVYKWGGHYLYTLRSLCILGHRNGTHVMSDRTEFRPTQFGIEWAQVPASELVA